MHSFPTLVEGIGAEIWLAWEDANHGGAIVETG